MSLFFLMAVQVYISREKNRYWFPFLKPVLELQSEMNEPKSKSSWVDAIMDEHDDAVVCNYAGCGIVGHLDIISAAQQAVGKTLQNLVDALKYVSGQTLLRANNGNIEQMIDKKTGQPYASHIINPEPLVYVYGNKPLASGGGLSDLIGTMLAISGVVQPAEISDKLLVIAA